MFALFQDCLSGGFGVVGVECCFLVHYDLRVLLNSSLYIVLCDRTEDPRCRRACRFELLRIAPDDIRTYSQFADCSNQYKLKGQDWRYGGRIVLGFAQFLGSFCPGPEQSLHPT
jgi:hypothetical protein